MAARHSLDIAFHGLSQGALTRWGLTEGDAARRFHVVSGGVLHSGVDAFALLWDRMPGLRWLARLVRLPVIAPLGRWVYDLVLAPALFALHRRRRRRAGRARPIA